MFPLAFLLGLILDIVLYSINPALLPVPIVRLANISWTLLVGLAGLLAGLSLASKRALKYLGQSLPTRRLKITVGTLALLTALLYPGWQLGMSLFGPHRVAIVNTPYSGVEVTDNLLTTNRVRWEASPSRRDACTLTGAGYEVRATQPDIIQGCTATATNFSDFAFQIEMTLIQGEGGGIFFRDSQSGTYELQVLHGGYFKLYASDSNGYQSLTPDCEIGPTGCYVGEYLDTGLTITITVVARDASIEIYFNNLKMPSVTSRVSLHGSIGVFALTAKGQPVAQTVVDFANAVIWTDLV